MKTKWIRKQPFLLLEVMIAFSLIVLCIFPLISPHIELYKAKKLFLNRLEQDHVVNVLYVDLLEKLYRNEIPWETLQDKKKIPFEKLGYQGTYQFEEIKHKPPEETGFTVVLIRLNITIAGNVHEYEIFVGKHKYIEAMSKW